MTVLITIGCFAFLLMMLYDINQIGRQWKAGKYLFVIGCFLLVTVTILLIQRNSTHIVSAGWIQWISLLLSLLFLILLIYTLFFALPFNTTYVKQEHLQVYDQGIYALCRHPGVLWFSLCYLFLALAFSSYGMGLAGVIFSFMNFLYAYLQDKLIFPRTLKGYGKYQQNVPFLLPTCSSLRESLRNERNQL